MRGVKLGKKATKIILIAVVLLLTAAIPAFAATNTRNTANIPYWTLNHSTSTISNPITIQQSSNGTSCIYVGSEYYVPYTYNTSNIPPGEGDWSSQLYIFSPVNTTVYIDSNNSGVFGTVLNITANNLTEYMYPVAGSHIVSDTPVFICYRYHSNNYLIYDDGDFAYTLYPVNELGTDYYLPSSPTIISMVATQNGTNIQVDTNNSGIPAATYSNLNAGTVVNYTSPPAGTQITSNIPIGVVAVNYNWTNSDSTYAYSVLPTNLLGTDYWFNVNYTVGLYNTIDDYSGLYFVATQNNTQVQVNSTNYSLNAGQCAVYYFDNSSVHLTSNQPVGVAYIFDDYAPDPWVSGVDRNYEASCTLIPTSELGTNYPYSCYIVATQNNTQVNIDSNYSGIFSNTVYLNAGQAINTFYVGTSEGGALLTNVTGHIESNYPVLSYYAFISDWNGKGQYVFMYEILPFPVPPIVNITVPSSGSILNTSNVWINGTYSVNTTGIYANNQLASITINDSRFTLVEPTGTGPYGATGNFSFLAEGIGTSAFSVDVIAQDEMGQIGTTIGQVVVDVTPPTVSITIPSSDTTVNAGVIWINGTYNGTGSDLQSLSINDSRFTLVAGPPFGEVGTYSFCNNTGIPTGNFEVEVTATDEAGWNGTADRYVIVDQSLPSVYIYVPSSDSTWNTGTIVIYGTYDGTGTNITQINCNDSRFTLATGAPYGGSGVFFFSNNTPIPTGSFYVNVTVTKDTGTTKSALRLINVDQNPPTMTMITPLADTTINAGTIIISGNYNDLGSGVQQITCNDTRFTLQTSIQSGLSGVYMFVNNTPIPTSSFGVTVTATDGVGLQGSMVRQVIVNQNGVTGSCCCSVPSGLNQYANASTVGVELYVNTTNPMQFYFTSTTANLGGNMPANLGLLSSLSIVANDTSGIQNITIIIHYTNSSIANAGLVASSLIIEYWNVTSGQWVELPSTLDTNSCTVTAYTNHLTDFAIFGTPVPYSYTPLLLLLSTQTQSGLNPLIPLALILVMLAVFATVIVALRRGKEEQVSKTKAPTKYEKIPTPQRPVKYTGTQIDQKSGKEPPEQKAVIRINTNTPESEMPPAAVPKLEKKSAKTRGTTGDLEAKKSAIKDLMREVNNRFSTGKLTSDEYKDIYTKYYAKLAPINKKLGQGVSSIPTLGEGGCLFCGAKIPEDAKFCPNCGGAQLECSVCKAGIVSGDTLVKCPYCGVLSHREHLLEWIKVKGNCPNCSETLREKDVDQNSNT
jgi:hypothetical protein